MTAVVGLLNKRGIAIAADSAVTMTVGKGTKCTKNGSKMLRLSNVIPVSVMVTGNGNFIRNPWDVLVRCYRQRRGDIKHATVEACMHDFFSYIAGNDKFWNERIAINPWICETMEWIFNTTNNNIDWEVREIMYDGSYARPQRYLKAFIKELKKEQNKILKYGKCPQFEDYTIEQFREYAKPVIDDYFLSLGSEDENKPFKTVYPKDFLDAVREDVEIAVMESLTRRMDYNDSCAQLIFSGYGDAQEYPSLVSAIVCEGIDHRVNYQVNPEEIICISDERTVAFCPFAQRDVVMGLIRGEHGYWFDRIMRYSADFFQETAENLFLDKIQEDAEFLSMLSDIKYQDLEKKLKKSVISLQDKNQREWEKTLENYDLKAMASLAQSLIDLTGFHRILTFEQEGVGGPVDVAVITKNDGFTWLSRKSWYHPKNVNAVYGSKGI